MVPIILVVPLILVAFGLGAVVALAVVIATSGPRF